MIAPNGHADWHRPQRMHLSWSMATRPSSVLPTASTGHASAQASGTCTMAWNAQAFAQMPQLMHFSGSIAACPFSMRTAFLGQLASQGRARHPRHRLVTVVWRSRQAEQPSESTVMKGSGIRVRFETSAA